MKKKSQRLQLVLELCQREEGAAMEVLRAKKQVLDQHSAQLDGLKGYHAQYLSDYRQAMTGQVSTEQFQTFHNFVNQLSVAIEHQQLQVDHAQSEFKIASDAWAKLHHKTKSMDDLILKYRREEELEADKKLQKQLEDQLNARRRLRS